MVELNKGNGGPEEVVKKERKRSRKGGSDVGLNINSMMDMITILLVFLLVTLTSDPLSIKQDDFLLLAKSTVDYNPQDSVPITLTKNKILVDSKAVVKVDCSVGGQVCQREDYKREDAFYSVDKSFKEDGDESDKEMWVVRFSSTPVGHKMRAAFALLEQLDLLEASWGVVNHRPDRAPRGNIVREMEACLDDALGKKKKRN